MGINRQSVLSKIKSFFKFDNKNKFTKIKTVAIFCLGIIIVLIFLSSFSFKTENKKNEEIETNLSAEEYCKSVENRLCSVLGQVKGIGNVNVFVMVDSSPTIKYLEETKTDTVIKDQTETKSVETKIVLSKNGTITSPVVVVEIMPKITGVLIIATGAKNIMLKTTLINTVAALLNVDVSNVEVLEGK